MEESRFRVPGDLRARKLQSGRLIKDREKNIYRGPFVFVAGFYSLLALWTLISVYLLGTKHLEGGWPLGQLFIIGFVLAYTWYFSLGISYRIEQEGSEFRLVSYRRKLALSARDISVVEGPRFGLPIGFTRFRLEREKAYLFCFVHDPAFRKILMSLRSANPETRFKFIAL
jgi:hypothetical protein